MKHLIYVLAFGILGFVNVNAQTNKHTIIIKFSGMKSDKGDVYVALYNNEKSFLRKEILGKIATIKNQKATVIFEDIAPGDYAVSSFHDENNNKKMDTNFIGIPKEPIGISNNAKGFMGPPKYKDAKFTVSTDVLLNIIIR